MDVLNSKFAGDNKITAQMIEAGVEAMSILCGSELDEQPYSLPLLVEAVLASALAAATRSNPNGPYAKA